MAHLAAQIAPIFVREPRPCLLACTHAHAIISRYRTSRDAQGNTNWRSALCKCELGPDSAELGKGRSTLAGVASIGQGWPSLDKFDQHWPNLDDSSSVQIRRTPCARRAIAVDVGRPTHLDRRVVSNSYPLLWQLGQGDTLRRRVTGECHGIDFPYMPLAWFGFHSRGLTLFDLDWLGLPSL